MGGGIIQHAIKCNLNAMTLILIFFRYFYRIYDKEFKKVPTDEEFAHPSTRFHRKYFS